MKFSKFNVLKSDDINTYIFNTLTGSFVRLSNENYNSLWSSEGKEIREGLLSEGILTENPNEVFAYKYRYYKQMFNPQKVHLCIAPTMKCNFNCFYCFEEGNKNLSLMNEAVENAIIRYIEKNKENDISISWFGGEPLLGFERIVSMSETLNRKNIQYTSSIITNGSLLTKKKIKQLELLNLT